MFEPITDTPHIVTLMGGLTVALLNDLLFRRIPNGLILLGLMAGFVAQVMISGPSGLLISLFGVVVGFACLLPFYVSGGMGAGDVKLMAMAGAFLGPIYVAIAAIASLVIGAVIGILWFFWHYFSSKEMPLYTEADSIFANTQIESPKRNHAIPYAMAIYAGVIVATTLQPIVQSAMTQGIF